jgi:hypothetical protein
VQSALDAMQRQPLLHVGFFGFPQSRTGGLAGQVELDHDSSETAKVRVTFRELA